MTNTLFNRAWLVYSFLGMLVVFNIYLLFDRSTLQSQNQRLSSLLLDWRTKCKQVGLAEAEIITSGVYNPEEYAEAGEVVPRQGYTFILFTRFDDCSNCVEQEISVLNQVVRCKAAHVMGIYARSLGIPLANFREKFGVAFRVIAVDSIQSIFGVSVENTPLVTLVNNHTKEILDAYSPEVNNFAKRNAFYRRWQRALNLGLIDLAR
jgi:hypothetical protein